MSAAEEAIQKSKLPGKWEQDQESWYCDPCAVEVYERRCPHCGKTKREKS
jgi:rubrerythrin